MTKKELLNTLRKEIHQLIILNKEQVDFCREHNFHIEANALCYKSMAYDEAKCIVGAYIEKLEQNKI